ncbi:Pkinase-domain-containing protein [Nemania abortiva]|nr:Pkinase-domain-containing protein [Nemania abortiva]
MAIINTRPPINERRLSPTTPPPQELCLGLFEIGRTLGEGSFGRVCVARHRQSGYSCAIKSISKDALPRAAVMREIEIQRSLKHPGIVELYAWFEDSSCIYIILEYAAGGDLCDALRRETRFSEQHAAACIAQVASALAHMHSKNIMHRDIKLENILLSLNGEVKLADFGLSILSPDNRETSVCGTPEYYAPEMLQPDSPSYTNAIDSWALGVLAYELLVGHSPFRSYSWISTPERILERDMDLLPESISPHAENFIDSLLAMEPSERLSPEAALVHPWIVENSSPPME